MEFDVAIIGGGIVGSASAYYLSKSGASVVLIDRGQINRGASGRNAGSLHFQLEHRFLRYDNNHWDVLAHLLPLNRLAVELWENIEDEIDSDLEVMLKGGLMVAETREQLELLKKKHQLEQKCGIGTEIISGDQTRDLCPMLSKNIIAASYYSKEGHCNPRHVTTAFVGAAVKNGTQIRTESEVIGITRAGNNWQVKTKAGEQNSSTILANTILDTANADADKITAMVNYHLPMFLHNLTINVTEKVSLDMPYMLQHVGRKLSLKQVRDGSLIIGGGWPAKAGSQYSNGAAVADVNSVIGNMRAAAAVLPDVKNIHLLRSWAGSTSDTSDQLPLLGPIGNIPNFYIATGGNGVTYGLAYAKLVSEHILTNSCTLNIDAFSPDRFSKSNRYRSCLNE